jgi:hypothetical protein
MTGYALAGIAILLIFAFLGRYALRETPPEPAAAKTEPARPEPQRRARSVFPSAELPAETLVSQPQDSAMTNAATLYRQAFALYDALSKDEKGLLGDWRTNVDASAEAELCEKIRPICDLMHEAGTVKNCDWGIEPLTFDTIFYHLASARTLARAAIWTAAHCRSSNVTEATQDAVSVLRFGQHVSDAGILGRLVDGTIQDIALSYVAANLDSFRGADSQRLTAAFDDPSYSEAPGRAME